MSRSCDEFQKQQVEIVASAVEEAALSLVTEEVQRAAASAGATRLPVRFDSVEDEAHCFPQHYIPALCTKWSVAHCKYIWHVNWTLDCVTACLESSG